MSDPASLAFTDVTPGPTWARPEELPGEVTDKPTMLRLALWLADVSAEAAVAIAADTDTARYDAQPEHLREARR